MYETPRCFKCGELGHIKAECPERRTPAAKAPVAAPAEAGGERITRETIDGEPVTSSPPFQVNQSGAPVADAHVWANRLRAADPRMGVQHCGEDGDINASEFRRMNRLPAAHECRLRLLAAQQAAEARAERGAA
jgi:hypothetical protein